MKELRHYTDRSHKLSMRRQCDLLGIHRSGLYYRPSGETEQNLHLMHQMDKLFTGDPTLGVLGMQDELKDLGLYYNVKRIRRLLRKMDIEPIYPKKNLSRLGHRKYVHPYLLRNLKFIRPNQVWEIDITYIPMKSGFMYLTAIIDVYSRYIVAWQLSNTLDKENQTDLLQTAIDRYGKPENINSDQGSQYTCSHWVETRKESGIQISMNGKGRATTTSISNAGSEHSSGSISICILQIMVWTCFGELIGLSKSTTNAVTRELKDKNLLNCTLKQRNL